MSKPFSNFLNKKKSKESSFTQEVAETNIKSAKSAPLIIFGLVISLSSIFLLLYTINNKFG